MTDPGDLFADFNARPSSEAFSLDLEIPDDGADVGRALEISYRSDKWGEGVIDYFHPFDSDVRVVAGRGDRRFRGVGPPRAVRVPGEVARLGTALELKVLSGGATRILDLEEGPGLEDGPDLLAFSRGARAVLVIATSPAIILEGGRLRVEDRGITG